MKTLTTPISSPNITVMEPTWDGIAHLPGNLGLLRVVCGAYPNAVISFVGGASQIAMLKDIAPPDLIARVQFVAWAPGADADTLPSNVLATRQKLISLPPQLTNQASLLVLCSCTATVLTALCWMGLASKSVTMLHGNANELDGWRSRNPFRSLFDLTGALKRFCRQGGKVTVLEDRICQQLGAQNPWLQKSLLVIPHPLLPEEARPNGDYKRLNWPIKIGFAGLATIAKGFPDFLELAWQIQSQHPGRFEFHAFGKLPGESAGFDQSSLATQAKHGLTRSEFVAGLSSLHYLFVWHQDNYYSNAASGVVYDAINLGIPMIARRCAQISEWTDQGVDVANSFDDLPSAIQATSMIDIAQEAPHYKAQCAGLDQLRESLSLPILSKIFVQHFPL